MPEQVNAVLDPELLAVAQKVIAQRPVAEDQQVEIAAGELQLLGGEDRFGKQRLERLSHSGLLSLCQSRLC